MWLKNISGCHCEKASDEAIFFLNFVARLLRFARNDNKSFSMASMIVTHHACGLLVFCLSVPHLFPFPPKAGRPNREMSAWGGSTSGGKAQRFKDFYLLVFCQRVPHLFPFRTEKWKRADPMILGTLRPWESRVRRHTIRMVRILKNKGSLKESNHEVLYPIWTGWWFRHAYM